MTGKQTVLSCFVVLSCIVGFVSPIPYEEDVSLTEEEVKALEEFKSLVVPRIPKWSYIRKYVGDDLYFVHWLRASNLNIASAEEMFFAHLRWREMEKMDNIKSDGFDWKHFDQEYPLFFNRTVDKEGRPLGEIWIGDWNIREGARKGMSRQIIRTMARFFEMLRRRVFRARANGRKVSQAAAIIDTSGFSLYQHGCPSCIPVIVSMANLFENHYAYLYDSLYFGNTSFASRIILNLVLPLLSDSTSKALKIFTNKNQLLRALDEKVSKNQRSVRFGGTIVRDVD